ncbi:ExeA family protein [Propionivibrio limicola]|uniref:ExeA family protein n=1 Tax=Propionivibrio limicola TaxID=167645 RepID=UPI0012917091|nr:AAA family ATPase [Propionivibrio limicola]
MYLSFFGLSATPFSIAPDPGFLYLTEKHQEALAHLLYSTAHQGGFVLLTGEIGTGKTTLCRHFLKVVPEQYQTAFIFNPKISSEELLATICDEFGIERPAGVTSTKPLTDLINARLLDIHAAGKNALLVIDEAQNLSMDVLEQIRLLTNLETTEHKLLQIILIGQPQLRTLLGREELRQLSQRVVARYHLEPLSMAELASYVRHRLVTSGAAPELAESLFPAAVLKAIYQRTGGVPRLINVLCDRALLGAYVESSRVVTRRILDKAAREVFGDDVFGRRTAGSGWRFGALGAALASIAAGVVWLVSPPVASDLADFVAGKEPHPFIARATASPDDRLEASSGDAAMAFRALLQRWEVPAEAVESISDEKEACLVAKKYRLRCFSAANKGWHQFRQLNSPAVLTLRDADQRPFHALIEAVSGDQASLIVGGQPVKVSLQRLAFYWTGEFTVLWQPPRGYEDDSQLTAKALAKLQKEPPRWVYEALGASESADVPLRQLVAQFQRKAGLADDGIIGVQTLLMLSRASGRSPSL